jgi:NAD(P)-dependent dehydrogenase (short-subunit alcohol dehydrogenase family)
MSDASSDHAGAVTLIAASLALIVASCGDPSSDAVARDAAASAEPASADARVVLVTGSTDGLGREVARRLAADGNHVIVHGRDEERGRSLVNEIEATGVGGARFYAADFGSLENVRELAAAIRRDYDRLDVLVNNAGMLGSPDERSLSADGYELHFQVNYLAGYLLTRLLLPMLEESAPARIVNVASRSQRRLDFENLMLEEGYSAGRAYGQSKLAQIMFTFDLAAELEGTGVAVNALHPATLMDTDLVTDMGMEPRATVDEGAQALVHLVDGEDVGSGAYYNRLSRTRAHDQAYDTAARNRLEEVSRRLAGLDDLPDS